MAKKPKPTPEEHQAEGYRQVGRYVTEFSRLLWVIRDLVADRLRKQRDPPNLIDLVFRRTSAEPLVDTFFDMCRMLVEHEPDETEAADKLNAAITKQIKWRNRVAHGDLAVGYWSSKGGDPEGAKPMPPEVWQVVGGKGKGRARRPDFDANSDELETLRTLVWHYGHFCLRSGGDPKIKRVRDVLVVKDGKPSFGPYARQNVIRI